MKKHLLILLSAISFTTIAWAQNVDQHVIGSAGGIDKTDKYTLEWTAGESAVLTVSHPNGINTEGFHQSSLKVLQVQIENKSSDLNINVYPNPVYSILNVKISSQENTEVLLSLMDMNGKKIAVTKANSENDFKELDMTNLVAGPYLLHIYNSSGSIIKTYKISKTY